MLWTVLLIVVIVLVVLALVGRGRFLARTLPTQRVAS